VVAQMPAPLVIVTIYAHPEDHPSGYVARAFVVTAKTGAQPGEAALVGSLAEARAAVALLAPRADVCLGRSSGDPSHVVESWV
jgi:hypothetical protein